MSWRIIPKGRLASLHLTRVDQLVPARPGHACRCSRILTLTGRGTSLRDLPAAQGGARSSAIDNCRNVPGPTHGAADAPLLLINEWTERAGGHGHPGSFELIVPD